MAQTKPKAGQFYGVSNNGTDGQFLKTDGTGGMSWDSPITNPTITSIDYPGSATAADPAGGESVIINGTLFASGITCTIGGTSAVTAFNSATQITITTPAKAAGQYTVAVTNPNGGTASEVNFIQYSGVPVWSTASGNIGSVQSGSTASFQVTATEGSDTIEYAVTTGSLPSGLSLATATGAITGTAGSVSASTTTTFSITATDDENQTSSARSFNITVTPDLPSNHFNTVLYTGINGNQSISSLNFKPGLTWIKSRDYGYANLLADTVRGAGSNKMLISDFAGEEGSTDANYANAQAYGYISSLDTNGFSLASGTTNGSFSGTSSNVAGSNYVSWNWKAGGAAVANTDGTLNTQVSVNNTLGFSIVSGSVPSSGYTNTLGHGLSSAPELIIYKSTNITAPWFVFANYGGSLLGNNNVLRLNDTSTASSDSLFAITSTTFKTGATSSANEFIAYCFTSKPGFSKVGTYTGARPNDVFVQTGFKPAFIMIKATNATDDWFIVDDKREGASAPTYALLANSSAAESSYVGAVEFLTNGFKLVGSANSGGTNNSGTTFMYLAFAANPSTTTPSLANSFQNFTWSGSGSAGTKTGLNFQPDAIFWKAYNSSSYNWKAVDSVRGKSLNATTYNNLYPNLTNAQNSDNALSAINANNIEFNSGGNGNVSGLNYIGYSWKAGGTPSINTDGSITSLVSANQAAGFSIVQWIGTRPTAGTLGHGLGLTPEMIIIKNTSITSDWTVYAESEGPTKHGILDTNGAWVSNVGAFNNTSPTSNVFTVGGDAYTNGAGNSIIAYCFTSISGYSKVGSYTGTSGSVTVSDVGFQPTFLLIKGATAGASFGGSWLIVDSARGDGGFNTAKFLSPNSIGAEFTNAVYGVTFTSNGFTIPSGSSVNLNTNNGTFIYLAIKEN